MPMSNPNLVLPTGICITKLPGTWDNDEMRNPKYVFWNGKRLSMSMVITLLITITSF